MSEQQTGATPEQIAAAKAWTARYEAVLVSAARAIAAESVRRTVPPDHRIVGPDDLAALRRVLAMCFVGEETSADRDRLAALVGETTDG